MAAFFSSLRNTVIAGIVLLLVVLAIHFWQVGVVTLDEPFWAYVVRSIHILSGIMWIGLLYYFNFVSTPTTPSIPMELRPALGKYITPSALFWFRWGAMSTIVFGLILAGLNGYLAQALTLDATEGFTNPSVLMIGIGMWLGIIMWFNVWFIIWPNQQKILNIGNKYPNLTAEQKAAAAKPAGMFSRINTMLSIPMLFCMAAASHLA
jgi:uncharacterized membrane protein